jgi:hypothetical protein
MAGTLIGAVFTALGWFGIQEFLNFKQQVTVVRSAVTTSAEEAEKQAHEAKKLLKEAKASAEALAVTLKEQVHLQHETKRSSSKTTL